MASQTLIPRFLLPQQSPLWRGIGLLAPRSPIVRVRYASKQSSSQPDHDKPITLEKPARFNPPSHGSRLKRTSSIPKHYGPALTTAEIAQQNQKHYPGLMAPRGSWGHWFWHSRALHTFITMGTLFALAIFTFFMNYARNSPFKDLLPPIADLWHSPLAFMSRWKDVIVMHEKDKAVKAQAHRFDGLDDAAKRRYYMKMHGIEPKNPVYIMFGPPQTSEAELEAQALGPDAPSKQGKNIQNTTNSDS